MHLDLISATGILRIILTVEHQLKNKKNTSHGPNLGNHVQYHSIWRIFEMRSHVVFILHYKNQFIIKYLYFVNVFVSLDAREVAVFEKMKGSTKFTKKSIF